MNQLSGLDALFLHLETPQMPMHVGALHLFELPKGQRTRFVTLLRRHVRERLPLLPALRRRLWWMPLNLANPAWVDADPDLSLHIVPVALPKGSGQAELEAAVARLHVQLLDRERPLWKFHVFEGLAPGEGGARRVALYTQLHHAAVDGQAAVALARVLLDVTPVPRAPQRKASRRRRQFELGIAEMLRGALAGEAQKVVQIVRGLPATVATLKDAAGHLLAQRGRTAANPLALAPRMPLNVSVGATRAFAGVSLPLPELKQLARAHGATLNDVVLMLCSSALRRFYGRRRALPRKSLVAAVPVSLRAPGDATADNQASITLVNLGTNIADPRARLAHVKAANASMKATLGKLESVLPTDFPSIGLPWLVGAATSLYGKVRAADRIPPVANLTISNVPGPDVPLYLAGARMLTNYPASIVVHGLALNITVQSYDRSMEFGLMADGAALPEVQELARDLHVALDDLRALPLPGEADGDAPSLVDRTLTRARRGLQDAVDSLVGGAVDLAVEGARRGVVRSIGAAAAKPRPRRGKAPV